MYKIPHKKCRLKKGVYKNKNYLSWLGNQNLTCLVCGNPQIEIHHIQQGSKGRADNETVPLCSEHHRGQHSPHGSEKRAFEAMYMPEMVELAKVLFEKFSCE